MIEARVQQLVRLQAKVIRIPEEEIVLAALVALKAAEDKVAADPADTTAKEALVKAEAAVTMAQVALYRVQF